MKSTNIEWCDHTWSPWRGCTKVSPGCAHCYAEKLSKRNPSVLGQWGKGKPRVLAKNWKDPVEWNRDSGDGVAEGILLDKNIGNRRVFPSLCDWLDEEVPIEWLARFLCLIHDTPYLDWLLLTKRPEMWASRMIKARNYLTSIDRVETANWIHDWLPRAAMPGVPERSGTPPRNVWIGASVEDQHRADERIPELLKIPARLRFLSVEPLLGEVDLKFTYRFFGFPQHITAKGESIGMPHRIHWVIVGGESGPGSRPCNVEWIRSVVRQCATAGVPRFVKQLGSKAMTAPMKWFLSGGTEVTDPKGGDPAEWPTDLRVRQFPEVKS